ncbi:cell division protein FtsK, partial [Levilactobacillus brevis]|nr:cell division protein FtsK [Levilactobacillus brevis]
MATKRKTPRRRPTKRKPAHRKSAKRQPFPYTSNVLGLVLVALAMLGLFNLGVLGTLAANIVRLFLGDTYQFGLVIIGALGVALTVTGTWPQLARHYLIGSATIYGGWLLWISANHFIDADQHRQFMATIWHASLADLWSGGLTSQLGGGLIGAFELSIVAWLIALLGAQIAAWLIMAGGVMIFFQIPWAKVEQGLQTVWQMVHTGVQASGTALKRGSELAKKRQNQRPSKPASVAPAVTPMDPDDKDLPEPIAQAKPAAEEP